MCVVLRFLLISLLFYVSRRIHYFIISEVLYIVFPFSDLILFSYNFNSIEMTNDDNNKINIRQYTFFTAYPPRSLRIMFPTFHHVLYSAPSFFRFNSNSIPVPS